jgi:AraC-like DNA-binding protein
MYLSFSARNLDELFTRWHRQAGFAFRQESYEQILQLPPHLGQGQTRHLKLKSGLELTASHYECRESLMFQGNLEYPWLVFRLCLSGKARTQVPGMSQDCNLSQWQSSLSFFPALEGTSECCPNQQLRLLEVRVTPQMLGTLLGDCVEGVPLMLRQIALGSYQGPYWQRVSIIPPMQAIAHQIFYCPYHGITKRLCLEAHAIELIALHLHQLSEDVGSGQQACTLRRRSLERIYWAQEILLNNLENPPSLFELSQKVGVSDYTLKQGFRELFGTTVFGFLRQQRLEQARILLQMGELSVTEIALTVGYSSLSAFNAAFKQKFGINPSAYLNQRAVEQV